MNLREQLFAVKSIKLLEEEMASDNRLRRVLGPVSLTALGVGAIIGANALHTLVTVFDRLNNQIGFAPQQGCPALGATTLAVRPPSQVIPPPPPTLPAPPYRHHGDLAPDARRHQG